MEELIYIQCFFAGCRQGLFGRTFDKMPINLYMKSYYNLNTVLQSQT